MPMNSVNQLQSVELKKKLDNGEDIFLLDVREHGEFTLAEVVDRQQEVFFEQEIVVICHYGERSQRAADELIECGFKVVHNLVGGIDAWSQIIDATVPRYRPSG